MSNRDTLSAIAQEWVSRHEAAQGAAETLIDAYRAEVLCEAADMLDRLEVHPGSVIGLKEAYTGVATRLRRMATEPTT